MRRGDVYRDEMQTRVLTDEQIETLLTGPWPEEGDFARFAHALRALHHTGPFTIGGDRLAAIAGDAAEMALAARQVRPARSELPAPARRGFGGLRRRLAGGMAAAVLLSGMTGVAVAADSARPGDVLYGLDRALEAVGIGNGGAAERLAEARALIEEGEMSGAITQMADVVEESGSVTSGVFSPESVRASEALRGAADKVGVTSSDETRTAVAKMLEQIAVMLESEDFEGAELGARISELARAIGGQGGPASESQGAGRPSEQQSPGDTAPGKDQSNRGGPGPTPGGPPQERPSGPGSRP